MPASGFLRDLGAAFLAVLAAVVPARAGWRACPEAGPPQGGVLACCLAQEGAPRDPCCCQEDAPAPRDPVQGEAFVLASRCDCSLAPAPPERPARPSEAVLDTTRELQAHFAALVLALEPVPSAGLDLSSPCASKEPSG